MRRVYYRVTSPISTLYNIIVYKTHARSRRGYSYCMPICYRDFKHMVAASTWLYSSHHHIGWSVNNSFLKRIYVKELNTL
jgi:hypothetical protein